MQRIDPTDRRAALLLVAGSLISITLLCGAFWLLNIALPAWVLLVAPWLAGAVSLVVMIAVPTHAGFTDLWALRPPNRATLLLGCLAAVVATGLIYAGSDALAQRLGVLPSDSLLLMLPFMAPLVIVRALSTFGEEVAWRGHLQHLLAPWGFWRSASAVSAVWVAFHVPLYAVMTAQGSTPGIVAVTTLVGMFPLGLFLSALVERLGSIWPAVFASAFPMAAVTTLRVRRSLDAAAVWSVTGISSALLLAATVLLISTRRRPATAPDQA